MKNLKRFLATFMVTFLVVCFVGMAGAGRDNRVADVMLGSSGINWTPLVSYASMVVTVSGPDGVIFQKTFNAGNTPHFEISDIKENRWIDGSYTYELRVNPFTDKKVRSSQGLLGAG